MKRAETDLNPPYRRLEWTVRPVGRLISWASDDGTLVISPDRLEKPGVLVIRAKVENLEGFLWFRC